MVIFQLIGVLSRLVFEIWALSGQRFYDIRLHKMHVCTEHSKRLLRVCCKTIFSQGFSG